jgi:hypothetical protein
MKKCPDRYGYLMLFSGGCDCNENKTACNINGEGIRGI